MIIFGKFDSWYDRFRQVWFLVWSFKECQILGMVVQGMSDSWYGRSWNVRFLKDRSRNVRFFVWSFKECQILGMIVLWVYSSTVRYSKRDFCYDRSRLVRFLLSFKKNQLLCIFILGSDSLYDHCKQVRFLFILMPFYV